MIRPAQNRTVTLGIMENNKRPMTVLDVSMLLLEHLFPHPGQIMNELVSFGAIFSERDKIAGMRGPGLVRYYMNKHIAEVEIRIQNRKSFRVESYDRTSRPSKLQRYR